MDRFSAGREAKIYENSDWKFKEVMLNVATQDEKNSNNRYRPAWLFETYTSKPARKITWQPFEDHSFLRASSDGAESARQKISKKKPQQRLPVSS